MAIQLQEHELLLVKKILSLFAEGTKCYVFGSRARGTARKYSDLDIAIIGNKPLTLTEISNLKDIFSGSNLPYRVDIIDWHRISKEFQEIISRDWQEIKLFEIRYHNDAA